MGAKMASRRPGRPANHIPAAQALIDDNLPKLVEKGLQVALMGDSRMLSALLDRVWPPPAHLPVKLEPESIRRAIAKGLITGEQGSQLLQLASRHPQQEEA